MITVAIIQILRASAAITGLVQTIDPNIIPSADLWPAMYVSADGMRKVNCIGGDWNMIGTVEIGVYAEYYHQALEIIDEVRRALDRFSGEVNGVAISVFNGEEDPDGYDDELKKHVKIITYQATAEPTN